MGGPVVLGVSDDPAVLRTLTADLEGVLAGRFAVRAAHSGKAALHVLDDLGPGSACALVVMARWLGDMSAAEFAEAAGDLLDEVRIVLLDTVVADVATDGSDTVLIGGVVSVPWDRGSELEPLVEDLLADWVAAHPEPLAQVTVIGHRWAPHAHDVKDFLGGNHVPYRWLDLDRDRRARKMLDEIGYAEAALPVVHLPDGRSFADPAIAHLADALGMHVRPSARYYDVGIVGAGPAGLAAAVYGGSEGLSTILVERQAPGGQAGTSSRIENYLGFPAGVSGPDLARRALTQAEKFGVEIVAPREVDRVEFDGPYKILHLDDGDPVSCRALVVATGVSYKMLHAPGLARLAGAGVYYGAATSEPASATGQHVYVVGSANSAGQGALYFSRFAEQVTLIFRRSRLEARMSQYLVDQIAATPNIELMPNSHVIEAVGEQHLEKLRIEHLDAHQVVELPAEFLFVFVGAEPRNEWLGGALATDERGYLLCGPDLGPQDGWPLARDPYFLESNVPGVFVAGDARHGSIRRVAGAVGEGSTCIQLVHRYLAEPH